MIFVVFEHMQDDDSILDYIRTYPMFNLDKNQLQETNASRKTTAASNLAVSLVLNPTTNGKHSANSANFDHMLSCPSPRFRKWCLHSFNWNHGKSSPKVEGPPQKKPGKREFAHMSIDYACVSAGGAVAVGETVGYVHVAFRIGPYRIPLAHHFGPSNKEKESRH